MSLQEYTEAMLPAIEGELKRQVGRLKDGPTGPFHAMLAYHMGWSSAGSEAAPGKRIRPLLLLLVTEACGGKWLRAISASAAVEIIHNFSLLHDDIEDNSPTRRGRPTVWQQHGVPMAINAGDALFAISNQAIMDCIAAHDAAVVVRAATLLANACLDLTRGQFLDMSYEHRIDIGVEDYWPMVNGKTAALLAASAQIGALLGGADQSTIDLYGEFARNLGLAFQVQDDILGIWGDESETGKSAASDLVEGKRSLPVLFGLGRQGQFAQRWAAEPIRPDETREVAQFLKDEGGYSYSQQLAEQLTDTALQALDAARPDGPAGAALTELARKLLKRRS